MNRTEHKPSRIRLALVAVIGASIVTVAGVGAFAGLNAKATATQTQGAGTLNLTTANNGNGFSQAVANLAPGDVVNRYVNITNGGTLASQGLTLKVAATGTATLITNGTGGVTNKALTIAVKSCSTTWTPATGVCGGVTTTEIAATPLSTFAAAQTFATTTLASLASLNLQIQVTLPDQNETTADGVAPANTVQNGSVALSYEFFEAQRTATTTHS